MKRPVLIDTNLLVLLVVGSASPSFIASHKRLTGYSIADLETLKFLIAEHSYVLTIPHLLSEVSSLARHFAEPGRSLVQAEFRKLIAGSTEYPIFSVAGCNRIEFSKLGLTDALILCMCALNLDGVCPTLLTTDQVLARTASSLGYDVIDYGYWRETA